MTGDCRLILPPPTVYTSTAHGSHDREQRLLSCDNILFNPNPQVVSTPAGGARDEIIALKLWGGQIDYLLCLRPHAQINVQPAAVSHFELVLGDQ